MIIWYYISARKNGTEEPWQFVRTCEPTVDYRNPFEIRSEDQVPSYLRRLTRLGYETIVTKVETRMSHDTFDAKSGGIYVGNPNIEQITRRVLDGARELRGEFDSGYTNDLAPPRR